MPQNIPVRQVIRSHGRPMEAVDWNGEKIYRMERIYVKSHNQWYFTQDYDTHFIYKKTTGYGSSLMCTCGSPAGAFDYSAYKNYASNRGQVLCCIFYIQNGHHADGSH